MFAHLLVSYWSLGFIGSAYGTYSLALPVVFIIVLGHYSLIEVLAREREDGRREPRHRADGRAQEILLEELHVEISKHIVMSLRVRECGCL